MEIYGTLGPACAQLPLLTELFQRGMCGLRLNLSHRSLAESREWLELAQTAAKACEKTAQILMDLQGPELRVGKEGLPVELPEGEILPLENLCLPTALRPHVQPGQELLLDDGKLQVLVQPENTCRVLRGGRLLPRKSVAAPGVDLRLPALTDEDHENLRLAPKMGVTGVMQSFVRGREDLLELRKALKDYGGENIRLFAKVENLSGLESLENWMDLADCIVIARGDLGNAVPLWQLPAVQKRVAALCRANNKPFLVVTQMLASMEHRAVPTRAEVSDIFNAVLDGASALMLTGETAAGNYPAEAMDCLCKTAAEAQNFLRERKEL
jgi:pyruvate kinase